MKNYKFYILILFSSWLITACTNLEPKEVDSIVSGESGNFEPVDPTSFLASLYNDLAAMTDQQVMYSLQAHTTDEMIPPTRGVDWGDNGVWRTLHAQTWDATHTQVVNTWNQLNQRVFKANTILASNPSGQQAAEAKFLRAFFMYQVMDFYGQVPFREVDEGIDVDPRVFTRTEAYEFIVKDLTEAIPDLPVIAPTANNTVASKAAGNALLARIILNGAVYKADNPAGPYNFDNGDMNAVIDACDAVTSDGYALDANYFNNFEPTGQSEILFCSPSGSPQNRVWMTLHYSQNPSGWNGFTTLASFYDSFEAEDSRIGNNLGAQDGTQFSGIGRGFLVGQQFNDDGSMTIDSRNQQPLQFTRDVPLAGAGTEKGIRVMKYHPSTFGDTKYRLLRYSDVFLMKAEALMRSGDSGAALNMVNMLREARGASSLSSIDEESMLAERGRELYWEGIRRTDLIRFGKFNEAWEEKEATDPSRVLFPIPSIAISSNPNLEQNAGYN